MFQGSPRSSYMASTLYFQSLVQSLFPPHHQCPTHPHITVPGPLPPLLHHLPLHHLLTFPLPLPSCIINFTTSSFSLFSFVPHPLHTFSFPTPTLHILFLPLPPSHHITQSFLPPYPHYPYTSSSTNSLLPPTSTSPHYRWHTYPSSSSLHLIIAWPSSPQCLLRHHWSMCRMSPPPRWRCAGVPQTLAVLQSWVSVGMVVLGGEGCIPGFWGFELYLSCPSSTSR